MGLFSRRQKVGQIVECSLDNTSSPDKYKFDQYKVILDMLHAVGDLRDNPDSRDLWQRLDDCYYKRNSSSDGSVCLTPEELVLIRSLLGGDDGSIGALGHQARVELDKILSGKGIHWQADVSDTNAGQIVQNGTSHLRTRLEMLNSKALCAPVVTSLPDIGGLSFTADSVLLNDALISGHPSVIPLSSFSCVGTPAFRCWGFQGGFLVSSGKGNTIWKEVMYSDKLPSTDNESGVYATKLSSYTVLRKTWKFVDPICGLVRLRGRIVEHRDGILRAEFASIAHIFVVPAWVTADTLIAQVIRELRYNYPNVPMSILIPEQLASVLTSLAVRMEAKSMKLKDD